MIINKEMGFVVQIVQLLGYYYYFKNIYLNLFSLMHPSFGFSV
jgi:hypothetical protein